MLPKTGGKAQMVTLHFFSFFTTNSERIKTLLGENNQNEYQFPSGQF